MRLLVLLLLSLSLSAQQRVLIPVAYNGPGAFGSYWTTVVGAWNRTETTWRSPGVYFVVSCPIPEGCVREDLPAGQAGRLVLEFSNNYDAFNAPRGYLLQMPAGPKSAVWAGFDNDTGALIGDQMPTPWEEEFTTGPIFLPLVNVGLTQPARTLLRVYALDATRDVTVRVTARVMFSRNPITRTATAVVHPQEPADRLPGYGELSITDAFGRVFGVADLEVVQEPDPSGAPPVKLWAFVTSADTRTNEVTVVTPR